MSSITSPSTSTACINRVSNTSSSQKKSIPVALIILGLIGAGVVGLGLAVFGGHQNWWSLDGLSNLNQVDSIIMMSVSGGILILTIAISGIKYIVNAQAAKKAGQATNPVKSTIQQAKNSRLEGMSNLAIEDWIHLFGQMGLDPESDRPVSLVASLNSWSSLNKILEEIEVLPNKDGETLSLITEYRRAHASPPKNLKEFFNLEYSYLDALDCLRRHKHELDHAKVAQSVKAMHVMKIQALKAIKDISSTHPQYNLYKQKLETIVTYYYEVAAICESPFEQMDIEICEFLFQKMEKELHHIQKMLK